MGTIVTHATLVMLSALALVDRGNQDERPVVGSSPLNGAWKTVFTDSISSGTTYWTLEVQAGGSVSGAFEQGTISGTLDGGTFEFTITQTVEGCPGSYSGSLVLQNDRGTGTYTGNDCQGEHANGVISIVRATEEEIASIVESPVSPHQKPDWARDPDPTPDRIRLIVRGDDFGTYHSSNLAMEMAFDAGVMRSASVSPAAPWFQETAILIRSHPEWTIGLHLSISSESDRLRYGPILSPAEVPTLVAEDGYFFHSYPGWPLALEYLEEPPYLFSGEPEMPPGILARRRRMTATVFPEPSEVEAEMRAQIRRAQLLNVRIDYIDAHMGAAYVPSIQPVLFRLAKELGVPIPEDGWMGYTNIHIRFWTDAADASKELAARLRRLKPGLYRIVLHPLVDSPEIRAGDSFFGARWAREGQAALGALTSEEVKLAIREMDIELVSIRDLWDYENGRLK